MTQTKTPITTVTRTPNATITNTPAFGCWAVYGCCDSTPGIVNLPAGYDMSISGSSVYITGGTNDGCYKLALRYTELAVYLR